MELEGYKRLHQKLTNEDLTIGRLVTDRHRQLAKYVRETSPGIVHVHDVWHVAKGVTKKVHGLSKKKGCDVMGDWEQSVNNHMYWVASSTPEEEPELREAKWTSLANHIQNVHEGHSDVFPRCLHGDLDAGRRKRWLKPGTMVSEKFETIITSKTLIKDVKKMSNVEQTSYVESFHALINQFAPKMKAYKYHGMICRLHLAAIHFNTNIERPQATTRAGKKCYKLKKPKYKPGKAIVSAFKGPQDYGYVAELLSEVAKRSKDYKGKRDRKNSPPPLTSRFTYPSKDEVIKRHKSRFNLPKE
nr:uncharacterized protein LOC129255710 [Lytechinus pictus]